MKKCNGTKEKGIPAISLLRYRLGNVFDNRSMYMQMHTGSFKEDFSKNTVYRFMNSVKTNWLKFTTILASTIINDEVKELTDEKRSNVFILDDTLFNRTSCNKTELGSKVFDHTNMRYKKAEKRRKLAQMKATDTMLQLLYMATSQGIVADYVLFDSWFSNPAQLTAIKSRGMDVIAMVKKSSRINYEYEGKKLNIKQIYAKNKKRRGKSK